MEPIEKMLVDSRAEFDYKKFKEVFSPIAEIVAIADAKEKEKVRTFLQERGYLEKLEELRYSESTVKFTRIT